MGAYLAMNVLAICKNSGEKYIFFYDDESVETLWQVTDSFARNKELSFTRSDATVIQERAQGIDPTPSM